MDINYHAYQAPQFRILSGRQIKKVYRATLEYITRIGVNVLNTEARDLLARAGALEIAHQNSVAPTISRAFACTPSRPLSSSAVRIPGTRSKPSTIWPIQWQRL